MATLEIFCGIVVAIVAFYYYLVAHYDFWKKRGIPGPEPIPCFGTVKEVLLNLKSIGLYASDIYKQYKDEPMVGIYFRRQPVLLLKDPDLIKTVLIKDFSKFSNRGLRVNETAEPLSQHLFSLEPERWRPLRMRLSPTFTSGKLKEMFSLIVECSNTLETYLDKLVTKEEPIDCRELAAQFTTDVIGSCVFGINMNAMSKEGSIFREVGKDFFTTDWKRLWRIRLRESVPWLYTLVGYVIPPDKLSQFFQKAVLDMMEYRRKNQVVRHDFIDTLIDLQDHSEKLGDIELTEPLLAAQAFVFFVAGFETSSTTISNALYELAQNQDIQDTLREEIREHHALNKGEWLYENIKRMPYLDAVFKETLRKFPPLPLVLRKSVDSYTFEKTKLTIPKHTRVFISVYGIHHDPEIYPNPEVFDINRFKEDIAATRHPMHYLPFGDGPRNCIGARFAVFQTKIGLIQILRNFKVDVCKETQIPYIVQPAGFLLAPAHGINLKVTKVE